MIGRQRNNVTSSVDTNLSLEDVNDFFRTVTVSGDHQPANSFCPDNSTIDDYFCFTDVTVDEVFYSLQHLDTHKSTGPDGISTRFLNAVASELCGPLTTIYNKSLHTGIVLSAWKHSNVSPVHKGGDKSDPSKFRPYSVVPKVLEKLIANQLSLYLESCHLFHDHQGAYRSGRSSDQILLLATDTIVNVLD